MINIQETLSDGTRYFGWKSEEPLTPFAPDYEYLATEKKIFSEEECKEWNDYLLVQEPILLNRYLISSLGDGGTGLGDNSITSRFPHFNVLSFDFHLVEKYKTAVFNGIRDILRLSGNTNFRETIYANAWFNVLRQGEGMNVHQHGYHKNTFYGCHLNIASFETHNDYYHPVKFQEQSFHVPNKVGYLTLFPNDIPHSVSINRWPQPRISIAADLFTSTWLDEPESEYQSKNAVKIGFYTGS
jgi:hypothetical protein